MDSDNQEQWDKDTLEHLNFYEDKFKKWNSKDPYEPSFLFSWSDRVLGFLQKQFKDEDAEQTTKQMVTAVFLLGIILLVAALIIQ